MPNHSINIRSQQGFDIVVDFTLSDGTVRNGEKISIKPFYKDEIETVTRLDKRGNVVLDREGNPATEEKTVQVFVSPSDDIQTFLQNYADALLAGIQAERAPKINLGAINP